MAHHTLRIEEHFLREKIDGNKSFEVRFNDDRGFQKGDTVRYVSSSPTIYTKDHDSTYEITYVTSYAQKEGWVVFGDRRILK